jgi:predicted transcriptional regulator
MSRTDSELLSFFKALADASRLQIVGLLARKPYTVEELAALLELRPSTVSHHVAKLVASGLVTGRPDGHYHVYTLDTEALGAKARELLAPHELADKVAPDVDVDAYDRKVLATFLDGDGRIRSLPMQRKKFDVLLRHVLQAFEPGGTWSERQVNDKLKAFSADVASLRRGLIDTHRMERDPAGTRYRRTDPPSDSAKSP